MMTNALKGALLSGLVLPGLGQIVLKHYKRGLALMLVVLVGLAVMVVEAAQLALAVLARIESEGGALDMGTLANTATEAATTYDGRLFNFCLFVIVACWIVSIVDAYLIGQKKDRQASISAPPA
jgi:hypothetical protein